MKTKLPLLAWLAIVLALLPASVVNAQTAQQAQPWLRYTVKGEAFSVTLPVEPSMKTSDVFVMRLKKSRLERVIEAKVGELAYRIYVYENPKPRQSLKEFIAEQTERSDLNLTLDRELNVGKFAGQQYSSHDFPSTEQYFATDGRFYRFVVRGVTADHAAAQPFFSSVTLGKKPEGIEVLEGPAVIAQETGPSIFKGAEVDTKVRLSSKPEPVYTEEARNKGIEGTVILKAIFRSSGKITDIRVVQGLPYGLTERAISAARKIKFIPATKEGKFVSMWLQLEYNFNLY